MRIVEVQVVSGVVCSLSRAVHREGEVRCVCELIVNVSVREARQGQRTTVNGQRTRHANVRR